MRYLATAFVDVGVPHLKQGSYSTRFHSLWFTFTCPEEDISLVRMVVIGFVDNSMVMTRGDYSQLHIEQL